MWGRRGRANLIDTPAMEAFFEKLDHLNQEQLLSLGAAWHSLSRQEHEDAWTSIRAVGAREGLSKEIDGVRNKALAWATRGFDFVPYNRPNGNETWQQVKMEAGEAIVDAALAVALGSRLDGHSHDVLIAPWLGALEAIR